jgi:hypothetical protein
VTPQKARPAVPTLREAEAAGHSSEVNVDVNVDQELLIESAGGDSLPDVPPPDVSLLDIPLTNVPLPNVPLPEAHPDGSEGEE